MYQCVNVNKVKPECVEEVIAEAKKLAALFHGKNGNISYEVLVDDNKAENILIIERWETKEAFLGHADITDPEDPCAQFGVFMAERCTAPTELYFCNPV